MPTTVFIADDHAVIRDGLRALLEASGTVRVVGTADNGRRAVRQVCTLRPDVVVLDIAMPELNGLDAAEQIRETCPDTQVVILSVHGTCQHIARALRAGARGYLLKKSASTEVADAIRAVHAGHRYLSRDVSETLVDDYLRKTEAVPSGDPLDGLSDRERHVLQLVAEGRPTAEIAQALFLAPSTVHTYRGRVLKKLGLHSRDDLIRFAVAHGLTPEE